MTQPAHRVVQISVIDWANSLNGKPPIGADLARLIATLAAAVEADRASTHAHISERSDEAQKSHFAKVAEFVTGGDTSEAGMAKAERDYALHCLEREMALCQQADARLADALEIIKPFALLCDLDVKADQGDLDSVYPMVAVGRLRAARAFLDAVSGSTEAGK